MIKSSKRFYTLASLTITKRYGSESYPQPSISCPALQKRGKLLKLRFNLFQYFLKNYLVFFIFSPLLVWGEENVATLAQQAERLAESHESIAARKIYEQLLTDEQLPSWQKARIFYNLGTIFLVEHQPVEALHHFQKIHLADLSLPRFGANLFLNIGVAYLQYAQTQALFLDEKMLLIQHSLKAFEQAQILQGGGGKTLSDSDSSLLNQWMQSAHFQLNAVFEQRRQEWMKQAGVDSLSTFLHQRLEEWMHHFQLSERYSSTTTYFRHQAESLMFIWNALQEKSFSLEQKKDFDEAMHAYLSALRLLNGEDVSQVLTEWQRAIEALARLTFEKNQDFQKMRLNTEVVLLEENWTPSLVKNLLNQLDALKIEEKNSSILDGIKKNVSESVEAVKEDHPLKARFFLVAALSQMDSLSKEKEKTSVAILQKAVEQAQRGLQLTLLSLMISQNFSQKPEILSILSDQYHQILQSAVSFIPTVLKEQNIHFHEAQSSHPRCLQSPWDQVIPLYASGDQAVQGMEKEFKKTPLNFSNIFIHQEQMIKDWRQALNLLLHPPEENRSASALQKRAEDFRVIQEMYLQDQPQPEEQIKELHAW